MNSYLCDVPVLCIFFARPNTLNRVFEEIRKARPSKLFLYQDGPRNNRPSDIEKIQECRDIGAEDESTHNVGDIGLLPKGIRRVFHMERNEIEFPLVHPKYMIENYQHASEHMRILAIRHPWIKFWRSMESRFYVLQKYGVKKMWEKIFGKQK